MAENTYYLSDLLNISESEVIEINRTIANDNQIVSETVNEQVIIDSEVNKIISEFNLSKSALPYLAGHGLTRRSLLLLKSENLNRIFPATELGLQLEFEDELKKWKESEICKCSTLSGPSSQSVLSWLEKNKENLVESRRSESPSSTSGNLKSVKEILRLSLVGKNILDLHSTNNLITQQQQKQIVHLIIEYYSITKRKLRSFELEQISEDIIQCFPEENKETYFLHTHSKYGHPKGILYNAYYNFNKKNTGQAKQSHRTDILSVQDAIDLFDECSHTEYLGLKEFLKFNDKPWADITEKWTKTTKNRLEWL